MAIVKAAAAAFSIKAVLGLACGCLLAASLSAGEPSTLDKARDKVGDWGDDTMQGLGGNIIEKTLEKSVPEATAKAAKILPASAANAAGKVIKAVPTVAGNAAALGSDLATAGGAGAGGDSQKAFVEASASVGSAMAGFFASSMCAGPVAPVIAGIGVGIAAKEGIRMVGDEYVKSKNQEELFAVMDRLEPQGALRARVGKIQEAMEKARADNKPDLVAQLSQLQSEEVARFKQHQAAAKQVSKALEQMNLAMRQGEAVAAEKRRLNAEQEKVTEQYHLAWRKVDSKRESLERAIKAGKYSGAQLEAAQAKLGELTTEAKAALGRLETQEKVERKSFQEQLHAEHAVEFMQQRYSDTMHNFQVEAQRMYGESAARELAAQKAQQAMNADGSYAGRFYGVAAGSLKFTIAGRQVHGSLSGTFEEGPANATFSGSFDPVTRRMSTRLQGSMPVNGTTITVGFAGQLVGSLDGRNFSGQWAAKNEYGQNSGTWNAGKQ